jgi:AraC-like DNA-binding protein
MLVTPSRPFSEFLVPLRKVTGLCLDFIPAAALGELPARRDCQLCRLISDSDTSACCLPTHHDLRARAKSSSGAEHLVCPNGLALFAVPVSNGSKFLGWIEGGPVFTQPPDEETFQDLNLRGRCGGWNMDVDALRAEYFLTPILPPARVWAAAELVQYVLKSITQKMENAIRQADPQWPPQIAHARRLAQDRFKEKLSIGSISRAVGLSEDYFSKLFKRTTGVAFTEHVTQLRVSHAKEVLAATDLGIAEIAYESGFESVPHFNRMFKRSEKMAPRFFRAWIRKRADLF